MKQFRFIFLSCLTMLAAMQVQANDYLEQRDHYLVYGAGSGVVHFKIPVYSRGGWDYLLTSDNNGNSAFYFKYGDQEYNIFYVSSEKDSDGPSADDDYSYGRGCITAMADRGVVEVTNTHNGTRAVVPVDGQSHAYNVTKVKEILNDNDYVTWLEIDWYMPEILDGKTVEVGCHLKISRRASSSVRYTKDFSFGNFTGADVMISPQLLDPFFYTAKDAYVSGYGCAAVPYMLFYDPYRYYPHFGEKDWVDIILEQIPSYRTDNRTDNIYVQTTDTVQPGFRTTFSVYRRKSPDVFAIQSSNAVTIPAYHRIYDFAASEHLDEHDTYTGKNILSWRVKSPNAPDLVEGDYFEVQRALKSDFSDAQTLNVVQLVQSPNQSIYTLEDDNRDMLSGNANWESSKVQTSVETTLKDYVLRKANGDTICVMDIKATAEKMQLPAVPVYYRIRRASASMWGWKGHDFARETVCNKHSFLAPLASTQLDYAPANDFNDSHKVHFYIKIENAETNIGLPAPEDIKLEYNVTTIDSIDVHVKGSPQEWRIFIVVTPDGEESRTYQLGPDDWSFRVPYGTKLQSGFVEEESNLYVNAGEYLDDGVTLTAPSVTLEPYRLCFFGCDAGVTVTQHSTSQQMDARLAQINAHLIDSIRPMMLAKATENLGRCMWDKTARLVLEKTMDNAKQTIIIPQDSIRRLSDGNWEAHYVDVADHACTNYSYAVRIDQSSADLHVSDSAFLEPIVIHGPNLYYDEGADISEFTASNRDAKGDNKRGIRLKWTPSTAAVDYYVLMRRKLNDLHGLDTIYRGLDNSYFDTEVSPEFEYNYWVKAVYECNGRHTEHEKNAIGIRSPYGEISGRILMPDNSGIAGVSVALQDGNGNILKSVITRADGTYAFDSLTYDFSSGTDYTIIPSAQYGTFSFNNTDAATAIVHLELDNCIASNITFANTSTVRLTGRALYKGSTIPVADAMFLLNGDTIRRNKIPLTTNIDGTFELTLTTGQPYQLQIFKAGHTFEGNGILQVEQGSETFALTQSLDGVRFYDLTKVRLVGRVAGGNDQRDLPEAFGLGRNNIGDDLQLVIQLEGDNTSHFVHDPNDITRDTMQCSFNHIVYSTDPLSAVPEKTVGRTSMLMEKKRITIHPDATTGEFEVDLYPVKYKVVQASAKGYATLFASGQGSETFDLTNAPMVNFDKKHGQDSVHYNAVYDRIYRTPVQIHMQQLLYGLPQDGFGEKSMKVSSFNVRSNEEVALYKMNDGIVNYTMGYPVFCNNRKYQFEAQAYEDYYYNNDRALGNLDRIPQRGGSVTIHNGMEGSTVHYTYQLDSLGKCRNIYLTVDQLETEFTGTDALHTVSAALEVEGNTVETEVFRAFISGDIIQENELQSTDAAITILDIVRDPGGNGSSAWVESGTTYNYSYTFSYDIEGGIEVSPTWGVNASSEVGMIEAVPGTYTGTSLNTHNEFSVSIPLEHKWSGKTETSYTFTTNQKISTSSAPNKQGIGSNADVFLGVTASMLTGKAKSVSIINDTLYRERQPAIQAGTLRVLAQSTDSTGKSHYLVVGEKVAVGSRISNTFAYTQYHILNTVIPRILRERNNLLETFASEAAAKAAANQRQEPVYWYRDSTMALQLNDTLAIDTYMMIKPNGNGVYSNRVEALDNALANWISVLHNNEKEKVNARYLGTSVGTFSVSAGTSYTHTDSYSSAVSYSELPQGWSNFGSNEASAGAEIGGTLVGKLLSETLCKVFSQSSIPSISSLLNKLTTMMNPPAPAGGGQAAQPDRTTNGAITQLGSESGSHKFSLKLAPIIGLDMDTRNGQAVNSHKNTGFTIEADKQGEITVAVFRAQVDSVWNAAVSPSISTLPANTVDTPKKYGSYVFFTQAGATYCMYEDEDTTRFYNHGTVLNTSTMLLAKPEMSINTFEQTNVLPDQRAKFKLELRNAGEVPYGWAGDGTFFSLSLCNESNPHGAKLFVNGAPLAQGIEFYMEPGQSFIQTLEVERGDADDYENLQLCFQVSDCPKNWAFLDFSVHFIPLSCDVQIDMPRQNWVMNTLSQQDSTGYYLPVEISGFDTHYKNFDHIEFQYKLSKESEDMWINQCSFFAEDSLYEKATGNKAMIENGRILPFRFYGERDPMEQEYDLRAVSFCRYGSGFVHKASTVISGVKDTRPPRVFGQPKPVNSVLGVGDDLMLRFSEPIAGNYLDVDNNFSLTGVTNKTGITAGTSLHFDGTNESYAATKVNRNLANKSVSVDMLVKPTDSNSDAVFFTHGADGKATKFGLTADRRLYVSTPQGIIRSKQLDVMLDFTHVTMVYDHESNTIRFFAGTREITDPAQTTIETSGSLLYNAPLIFGRGFNGNMLEARVWTKALTPEEVAATNMKRLTGYERGLVAYYPMNEGQGETCSDKANGATLYLDNTSWTLQKGISLHIENDSVKLDGNLMSRSDVYDETFMIWFKTASRNAPLFRAGWTKNNNVKNGTWLGLEDGLLTMYNDSNNVVLFANASDNEWHHFALAVNRAYNTASFFMDGKLQETVPATTINGIKGAMFLGGKDFNGYVDELTIYEQALPRALIEERYNMSPAGDEMGLMAYLPFSEQKLNPNGVLELVYSGNDQRIIKKNGVVVEQKVPLVISPNAAAMADKTDFAPVRDHGLLTKLNFDWAFNNDELLINLNMEDYEINKQTVYVTVRDVEDLHGNPMASPVTWMAYVDRNTLKWEQRNVYYNYDYDESNQLPDTYYLMILNTGGRAHQFTIDNIPDWLTLSSTSGTLNALDERRIEISVKRTLAPGEYTETIYLTDENNLAEPLNIHLTVVATAPYDEIDKAMYPYNMSVCARVMLPDASFSTDENDIVYAFCNDELVGLENIMFSEQSNESELYLTIYGNEDTKGKPVKFILWQASTGKSYDIYCWRDVRFESGKVMGCGNDEPLYFVATAYERQNIALEPGWNWISFNLDLQPYVSKISQVVTANSPWTEGDLFKNPATMHFSTYSESRNAFAGEFDYLRHIYTYMVYCRNGNNIHVTGQMLDPDSMYVVLRGNGRWSALPYLLPDAATVTEAMTDYFDHASSGDIIKSHDRFAVFSSDGRWQGNLTTLRPGEGYFLRRLAPDDDTVRFYRTRNNAPRRAVRQVAGETAGGFSNPYAATNMTMIAKLNTSAADYSLGGVAIKAFIDGELVAVAEPVDSLYFITIQSDKTGDIQFQTADGQTLVIEPYSIRGETRLVYKADAHAGSLNAPVVLTPCEDGSNIMTAGKGIGTYKIIENNHVIIIRNNERYDVTGRKLPSRSSLRPDAAGSGM